MNCAIYARVSTADQKCELQLRELRAYCERRGWAIAEEYVDVGWSGKLTKRPQLDRCMRDAAEHRFDCILVWKLDRWGRSLSHLIDSIQTLTANGIRWIAVTQNLDTDQANPMAKAMLGMMAVFAEFERSMIQERVVAGMAAAKHRGIRCGRPKKVFDRDQVGQLRARGLSVRAIAKQVGIGVGTVHRLLAGALAILLAIGVPKR